MAPKVSGLRRKPRRPERAAALAAAERSRTTARAKRCAGVRRLGAPRRGGRGRLLRAGAAGAGAITTFTCGAPA